MKFPFFCSVTIVAFFGVFSISRSFADIYYVDYAGGSDSNPGTQADRPWKHSPGDANAKGLPAGVTLKPGDRVILKGGVTYRGSIQVTESGTADQPIVIEGNGDGSFGTGMAVLNGGEPITGWVACASATEAKGNPNFSKILKATVPGQLRLLEANLVQANQKMLTVAQSPNMKDPFFQEDASSFYDPNAPVREEQTVKVKPVGMGENKRSPLINLLESSGRSAAINNLRSGAIEISWPAPVEVAKLGITPHPNGNLPKDFSVLADGVAVTTAALGPATGGRNLEEQVFPLPSPVRASKLEIRFQSAQDPAGTEWGQLRGIAAYDSQGVNQAQTTRTAFLRDPAILTQSDSEAWDGAVVCLWVRPNVVTYADVLGFDPARNELRITPINSEQYPSTKYSILNALNALDQPGEYVVKSNADGTTTIYLWPADGLPPEIEKSVVPQGVRVSGSYVTIRNLQIQQFAADRDGSAVIATGGGKEQGLRLEGVYALLNRSQGTATLSITGYTDVVVEDCRLLDNAGHARGILVRNSKQVLVRRCEVKRSSGTAICFFSVEDVSVIDCVAFENRGMHSNGLTFYLGCKRVLVEGNRISRGNVGLTYQEGEDMLIRNNVIESDDTFAVGVWAGKAFNNVVMINNTFLSNDSGQPALFGGNEVFENLHLANNIIGGVAGTVLTRATFANNLILKEGSPLDAEAFPASNRIASDPKAIFKGYPQNLELASESAARGAGMALALAGQTDVRGAPRLEGRDAGAYSSADAPIATNREIQPVNWSGFKFPAVPAPAAAKSNFPHQNTAPEILIRALDYTGNGGGELVRREGENFFAKWDVQDQWVEWEFSAAEAGNYELAISLASAIPAERNFYLNGNPVPELQNVSMKTSGAWKVFTDQFMNAPLPLQAGKNVLRVVNSNGTALNFRELRFHRIKN